MSDNASDAGGKRRTWVRRPRERSKGDYAGAVVGNLVGLVIFNLYPVWRPWTHGVVTEDWVRILWAADLSFVAQICGNLILLIVSPRWLARLMELVFAVTGLLSLAVFYAVFPLDFSRIVGEWLNLLFRVILLVGLAGVSIGVIVSLVRLIFFWWRPSD